MNASLSTAAPTDRNLARQHRAFALPLLALFVAVLG